MLRSLKSRLTLLYVIILTVILSVFAASIYFGARRELLLDFEDLTRRQAAAFSEVFFDRYDAVRRGVHSDFAPVDAHLRPLGAIALVYDGAGALLYRSEAAPARVTFEHLVQASGSTTRAESGSAVYRIAILKANDSRGGAYVLGLGLDEAPVQARLLRLLYYFAFFIPALVLLAWYVGRGFVRRALSPVDVLRRQAEQIQKSNLSERVPVPVTRGEVRDLAITLNDMLGRLERSFEQINSFTSNASHELKTPLANLRTEIELALEREADVPTYQRLLASVAEEVSRMTHIVENLLLLAQLDSKQAALRQEPVDLSAVAQEAAADMEILGETRGVQVRMGMVAPGIRVLGDAVALRRVMMNLLENGVKYNREGGEVKISVWKEDGTARVEVADTGVGVPPESLPHLFDRFFRVDRGRGRSAADAVGGHGLGLSITRSLVEAHGGKINVMSKEGVGTTFHIVLPAGA